MIASTGFLTALESIYLKLDCNVDTFAADHQTADPRVDIYQRL